MPSVFAASPTAHGLWWRACALHGSLRLILVQCTPAWFRRREGRRFTQAFVMHTKARPPFWTSCRSLQVQPYLQADRHRCMHNRKYHCERIHVRRGVYTYTESLCRWRVDTRYASEGEGVYVCPCACGRNEGMQRSFASRVVLSSSVFLVCSFSRHRRKKWM